MNLAISAPLADWLPAGAGTTNSNFSGLLSPAP